MAADTLKQQIEEQMKLAMRAKDKERLATIRLMLAAVKQREVDERTTLDDAEVLAVLDKMLKQRRDSIEQYRRAERNDLAQAEEFEVSIIQQFMPAPLSDKEVDALIDEAVAATGAAAPQDMGKVMGWLKPRLQGRADVGAASGRVKARLSGA